MTTNPETGNHPFAENPVITEAERSHARFTATVTDADGEGIGRRPTIQLTIQSDDLDAIEFADRTCGAGIDLTVELHRDDQDLSVRAMQSFDEAETVALIDALQQALDRSRELARERGYYEWVASGRPGWE